MDPSSTAWIPIVPRIANQNPFAGGNVHRSDYHRPIINSTFFDDDGDVGTDGNSRQTKRDGLAQFYGTP
jgi:hypothetical protein